MQLQFQMPAITISKKVLWTGVGVSAAVLLLVIVFGWIIFKPEVGTPQATSGERSLSIKEDETKPAMEEVSVYKDPLGFSFSYPDTFTINTHPEDQDNYANLELTNNKSGRIKLIVSDTTYTDIATWKKEDPEVKDANFLDSKIGSLDAKKVYSDLQGKKLIIAAIWDGMLFKIEATPSIDQNLVKSADKIIAGLNIPTTANFTDGSKAITPVDTTTDNTSEPATDEEVIE